MSRYDGIGPTVLGSGAELSADWASEISKGSVPGTTILNKYGSNSSVGTEAEVIWDQGGNYNWELTATPAILNVSSSSAEDTAAGDGARTILIFGNSTANLLQSETITLNGTAIVATTLTYKHVFRALCLTEGGNAAANTGDIYIYSGTETDGVPSDLTKVYAKVQAGNGQTLMTPFLTFAGTTSYLWDEVATSGSGKNANIQLITRESGGARNVKSNYDILNNTRERPRRLTPSFPAGTQIWMEAVVDTGTTRVSGAYDLEIVEDD